MAHVIIEIDGVRHKLVNKENPNVCDICSIGEWCDTIINSPCKGVWQYFEKCKKGE